MGRTLGTVGRISHRTQHVQVVDLLGAHIVAGGVAPGDQLPPEDELAATLGVSRAALREAVKALRAKGLVALRPRTGTRVLPKDDWNFLDRDVLVWQERAYPDILHQHLAELRRAIEPAAAHLACLRASDDELTELVDVFREMERTAAAGDYGALTDADTRFHVTMLHACHNDLYTTLGRALEAALRVSFDATARTRSQMEAIPLAHSVLLQAIVARDGAAAAEAAASLVAEFTSDILIVAAERGIVSPSVHDLAPARSGSQRAPSGSRGPVVGNRC